MRKMKRSVVRVATAGVLLWAVSAVAWPVTDWLKVYSGSGPDTTRAVVAANDGGFIVAGATESYGNGGTDMFVVKTDDNGAQVASWFFGGAGNEGARSVVAVPDGYVLAGYTTSIGAGKKDGYVVKIDNAGTKLWEATFGGSEDDEAYALLLSSDGSLIVTGYTESFGAGRKDGYVARYSLEGTLLFSETYGGYFDDYFTSIIEDRAGNYLLTGASESFGNTTDPLNLNAVALKMNKAAQVLFFRNYGGAEDETCNDAIQTSDNGYALLLSTATFGAGGYDLSVAKLTETGECVTQIMYGGLCNEEGFSISETAEGTYIIGGTTGGPSYRTSTLLNLDQDGKVVWSKNFSGIMVPGNRPMLQSADGNYVLALTTFYRDRPANATLAKVYWSDDIPPERPIVHMAERFNCVYTLGEIGFSKTPKGFWELAAAEGALKSASPGGNGGVSRILSRSFDAHRADGSIGLEWRMSYKTVPALKWAENNQLWVSLADADSIARYTVHYLPAAALDENGKGATISLYRNDNDGRPVKIGSVRTETVTPSGHDATYLIVRLDVLKTGEVVVNYDAADGNGLVPVLTVADNAYGDFSLAEFKYKTGSFYDGQYSVLIDNIFVYQEQQ